MRILRCAVSVLLAWPLVASAGLFSVTPIRVDLTPEAKAGSVTVTNDGGTLPLKVNLMRWTQDAEGKDVYEPANDLIYFPRELTIEAGASRTIRVLSAAAPAGPERAYRLFLEEGVAEAAPNDKAARLSVLVKFGVAVYTHAGEGLPAFTFDVVTAQAGKATVRMRNTGPIHAFVKELTAPGITFPEFKPRYVLSDVAAPVAVELTAAACKAGTVPVTIATAEGTLSASVSLPPDACK